MVVYFIVELPTYEMATFQAQRAIRDYILILFRMAIECRFQTEGLGRINSYQKLPMSGTVIIIFYIKIYKLRKIYLSG